MAFGIKKTELNRWKRQVCSGQIAFLTHYWYDVRFPQYRTVTKAGCSDIDKLISWGKKYGLKPKWIDKRSDFPHYDLMGETQRKILIAEGCFEDIKKFRLEDDHVE
ncbi:MAG: hypothetical protein ACO1OC_08580 [Tuberibacillus sp.]